ncbi:MAG TPA: MopE-related protein [Polyangia bacterium]
MSARKNIVRRSLVAAGVIAAVAGTSGREAGAQSLRPHILFIFDTSGSMRENAGGTNVGENTNICPSASTSKIYGLKSALRAALAQVGADEANFGLMSFPQVVVNNPNPSNWCGSSSWGHYNPTSSVSSVTIPNRASTGNHSATAYPSGCLMSTNTTESTYGAWFGTGASQVLRVGLTTAAAGVAPTATNYDPSDGNITSIYKWIDNVELPTTGAAVTDPELHANGSTPLGRSLFYGRMYYDNFVKPQDPRGSCRQNVVVLVTDGGETCDEATAPDTNFSLTSCTGGAAFNPFHPVAQACQLFRTSGIKTYVVTDSGVSSAEITANNRIAAAGGTTSAITVSLADPNAAKAAIVGIIAQTVPPAEVCNGKDDNCNGVIDEGVANMCPYSTTNPNDADNLLGAAAKHCAVETANCKDDNCNGLIDEGFPLNACGQPAGCPISAEICDGVDNDCDGDVDEGFSVGQACDNGLTGTCRRLGLTECSADGKGVTCNLGNAPVAPEVCNGIDDDCNGMIDDGLGPDSGVGVDCGIQGQGCQKGVTSCVGGKIVCNSTANPTPEVCNGLDDDCNGVVDDGSFPGVGTSCVCDNLDPAKVGVGECRGGRLVCKGAEGLKCDGCVGPTAEICDGKDNDCDGVSDKDAQCSGGFACREGSCALLCQAGEFPCPPGYDCKDAFCVPNRCRNVVCGAGQRCDTNTGSCVDLCYKVTCASGQTCSGGLCLDCSNSSQFACPAGQICAGRQCLTDTCAGVTCAGGEYCSNGKCVSLSCGGCPAGQKCLGGECRPFLCDDVSCASGTYCDPATGACMVDRCVGKTCASCAPATGECLSHPCLNVRCPVCTTCTLTADGVPTCAAEAECQSEISLQTRNAGGGCSCDAGAGAAAPTMVGVLISLAGLLAAAAARRSRRQEPRRQEVRRPRRPR